MYKIYYNRSLFVLSDDAKMGDHYAMSHTYVNPSKLHLYVSNKLREKSRFICFLYHTDVLELLEAFELHFQVRKAAGGLVENSKKNKFLSIFKRNSWDLPKGHWEKWETLKECAIREVSEECTLKTIDFEIIKELIQTRHIFKVKNQFCIKHTHWFLMNYIGIDKPKAQKNEGIKESTWFAYDKLDYFLSNSHPSNNDVLLHRIRKK